MAGFEFAGNLVGGSAGPAVIDNMQTGEDVYQGQLLMAGLVGDAGGHVQVADAASEANENDQPILGWCLDIQDDSYSYSSTYYGYGTTYSDTQAHATGTTGVKGSTVRMGVIIPGVTIVRAPLFNAAFGTALTELTVTSASTDGTTITHANDSVTDIDATISYSCTAYCRSGANRGLYRLVTTAGANANVVTKPFPYDIAVGDKFVVASIQLGYTAFDIPATANCIDGNNDLNYYYVGFCTKLDLSTSGKEFAELTINPKCCGYGL